MQKYKIQKNITNNKNTKTQKSQIYKYKNKNIDKIK